MAGIEIIIERDNFAKFTDEMAPAAGHVLYEEAQDIMTASQVLCPRDTGALANSAQVSQPDISPGGVEVDIGYGGPAIGYAVYVHEDMSKHHRAPTQAKFLEVAVNRAMKGFDVRIAARIRSLWGAWGGT